MRTSTSRPHVCFSGIDSFVVASLGSTVRGFKLDGDQHEEAMVPIGGARKNKFSIACPSVTFRNYLLQIL